MTSQFEQNNTLLDSTNYLDDQIASIKSRLLYALNISYDEIHVSFPTLKNFYYINNVYKSSWAIYIHNEKLPKLLFTGNFLIQGSQYGPRSTKSPFGSKDLAVLTSVANTFSTQASVFKQNWTMDLNLFDDENEQNKLNFTVKEYQEFLTLLNNLRAQWSLHLSEEGAFDFVIVEFSEPSDSVLFIDTEKMDSIGTKIKTYFKPFTPIAVSMFQTLSRKTEFEGKFFNIQPGNWIKDDVLIEIENTLLNKSDTNILATNKEQIDSSYANPFKVQALRPTF